MKEERSVERAALTQVAASWRLSALTWRLTFWASASSGSTAFGSTGDWSGEEKDLRREVEAREEEAREEWKERNCSTVG